jgi:hypothetical protein
VPGDLYHLPFVSQAPLPPHERTWRHPSELAAAEREAFRTADAPSGTRLFATVTGSVGLLAVGLLVLMVAPDRNSAPLAVSATTTPGAVTPARLTGVSAIGRFSSDDHPASDDAPIRVNPALATPVGDGRSALMTRESARHRDGSFDVRLTSGAVVSAAVVDTSAEGLVVVTIASSDQAHEIASAPPHPDDIVTVLVDPPVTVPFGSIDGMELAEGTPILDADGALVGICTRTGDGPVVLDVTGHSRPIDPDETDDDAVIDTDDGADEPQVTDASVVATTVEP